MKITLAKTQKLWFFSDPHYNHVNICRGVSNWSDDSKTRPFLNLEDMNGAIVHNINSYVKEDDILFCLGDWSFNGFDSIREFRNRINCKNVHLIYGNHDEKIIKNQDNIQEIFSSCNHYLELQVSFHDSSDLEKQLTGALTRRTIILSHFPICSWNFMSRGAYHLFGHVHLPQHERIREGKAMDVGMDGNFFAPYNFREIKMLLDRQPIHNITIPSDHHQI